MSLPNEFGGLDEPRPKVQGTVVSDFGYGYSEFEALLDTAEGQASSDWEMNFVEEQKERFLQWGTRMFLSSKQLDRLEKLVYGEVFREL